ncbi:trehalose-phosphatase [Nocardia uniformis]|uniref:trehalose-phosphatase n=1 Tax=Nocardia uniformis TaxID=53432 RepID=UPI0024808404|nr:trehalose-phosphatase [Nocardia uniformis]
MRDNALPAQIDARHHDAVLFDMDGVVTDSASMHAAAWTELFNAFLSQRAATPGEDRSPFTAADYLRYVDGKPRYSGVADFLAARGISLPMGYPSDPGDAETVCGLGNRKDQLFLDRLTRDGVGVFPGTVDLIRRLHAAGIGTAVFSASRNCAQVLAAAGLDDLFEVRVDGLVAERLGLAGKPDPAMLLEAARRLGAEPGRTVVVEDAEAGVEAGRRGGFAVVIGVDRGGHAERLTARGADVVVADVARVRLRADYRRMSDLPDILRSWPELTDRLDIEKVAVLIDFDGTLSDIVPVPDAAVPVEGAITALTELAAVCPVAIVSGRDLEDVRTRVGVPGLWYAGSHGFDLMAPDGTRYVHEVDPGMVAALDRAATELRGRVGGVPGVLVEQKRFAVAIHHRGVERRLVHTVVSAVHEVASASGLRVTSGHEVTELRPDVDWDKGRALRWILAHLDVSVLPIYLGDDLTDEDAFDAIESDGIAIAVSATENRERYTAARFIAHGPRRVRDFLDRLTRLLRAEAETAGSDSWMLTYDGYEPGAEQLREALCTVGNGYLGTRGAAPESVAGERHYPGTYVAGIYNRLSDTIAGRVVDNESLVNLPNWLPVNFRIADGDWFDLDTADLLSYRQQLDMRRAVLIRVFRFRDAAGRITAVRQRRFAAMHAPHLCALETTITAENWSGHVTLRSVLDGDVRNSLVVRYRDLASEHVVPVHTRAVSVDTVILSARTNHSGIALATAMRNTVHDGSETVCTTVELVDDGRLVGHDIEVDLVTWESVTLEKTVSIFTGRDHAISTPEEAAVRSLRTAGNFSQLLAAHTGAWRRLWDRLHIDLDGGDGAAMERVLRLHLLHLAQTLSPNTADLDVGVPARGLHGEAYRGHIFWDELFICPVLTPRFPALTASVLRYRHRRLPEARRAAHEQGWAGALFPWQSGSDGREESQRMHLNPLSGRWNPDPSHRAHHSGLAIAYIAWQYHQATGDLGFLTECGAELLVEIARFWASRATHDPGDDRYHIRGVIGPDEFHTGYAQAIGTGIDDNAYTNVMATWTILRALDALDQHCPRERAHLLESLGVAATELERWDQLTRRMYVPFHDGVISQFEGYDQLAELDWEDYRGRYGDIARLDRILEAEGDDINHYRAGKQADVLMLFYLLSADELRDVLGRLGYSLPAAMIPRTIDYYLARTSHGSTLSAVVHSWVLARANRIRAVEFLEQVLASDIDDIQGGTTSEGIHLGAMAGSVDLLQRCFTGLEMRADRLIFTPSWPETLGTLTFPIFYRGHRLTMSLSCDELEVRSDPGPAAPVEIECRGRTELLAAGRIVRLPTQDVLESS